MKNKKIFNIVSEYFDSETEQKTDTNKMLISLKPTIKHKCETIKTKKNSLTETLIFGISEVIVLIIGLFILFPELIDYTSEYAQIIVFTFLTGLILIGIYFIVNELRATPMMKNNRTRLRGNLS